MTDGAPTTSDLIAWMGTTAPAQPDGGWSARLSDALDAATAAVEAQCYARYVDPLDDDYTEYPAPIRTAILMEAQVLYERGVPTARADRPPIETIDPATARLLARYVDLSDRFA